MMALFWGGLVVLAVLALRAWNGWPAKRDGGPALGVLKARYARGEIARAEYEEIKRDIER